MAIVFGERGPLVQMLKSAIAVGLAWAISSRVLDDPVPYLAAVAALFSTQVTVYGSFTRGSQRVIGVVIGVLLAYFVGRLLGVHAWSAALIVLCGLLAAWLLRLDAQIGTQVAITALLVMALGALTPGYALDRVVGTLVGAVVGVAVSALVLAPDYVAPARRAQAGVAEAAAALLRGAGDALADPDAARAASAQRWDAERALADRLDGAAAAVSRARESVRWNPLRRGHAPPLTQQQHALALLGRTVVRTRGITRSLDELLADDAVAGDAARVLGAALGDTAGVLEELSARLGTGGGGGPVALAGYAPRERLERSLATLRTTAAAPERTGAWARYGSIAVDLGRIADDVAALEREQASAGSVAHMDAGH